MRFIRTYLLQSTSVNNKNIGVKINKRAGGPGAAGAGGIIGNSLSRLVCTTKTTTLNI